MYIRMIGMYQEREETGQERTPRGMKSRALPAMLAQTPGHRRPRRWLEARLWSDRGQERASGGLRQALTELRKVPGPLAGRLTSDRDCVSLGGGMDLSDVAAAREALGQGREFLQGIDILDPAFNLWLAEERQRVAARPTGAYAVARPRSRSRCAWPICPTAPRRPSPATLLRPLPGCLRNICRARRRAGPVWRESVWQGVGPADRRRLERRPGLSEGASGGSGQPEDIVEPAADFQPDFGRARRHAAGGVRDHGSAAYVGLRTEAGCVGSTGQMRTG